ncbi:nitroreductase/quinone reductase family protein [Cryptosporangium japonicum]|uniref:Nitroreductase family deazaflavin-dependent oxidoreductase n=1 Tax=Cryptosporangium japonicum TaxID=80872 RepID=A0ABP3DRG2_9ACTN
MVFDTRNGTRGARQPRGRLLIWANRMMMRRIRRGKGGMRGGQALVLKTVGAKSGAERESPLAWFPGEGDSWLICASAAGAAKNPAWYYNLAAHPDRVSIDVDGQTVPVTAEQLHGAERDAAWQSITASAPGFADYQVKTDRELPVIRLTRRAE